MTGKPLSYDSLKIVLAYTNPNIRFLLAIHVPSLRRTEKIVPLYIQRLSFDHLKMTINNTEYKFGTYRYYDFEVVHPRVLEDNQYGGAPYDIDELGFEDRPTYEIVTPGDIQIRGNLDQNLSELIKTVKVLERRNEFLPISLELGFCNRSKCATYRRHRKKPFSCAQKQIKLAVYRRKMKKKLNEFNAKYNPENIPKPKETFIQLTISCFGREPIIERVKKGKKKLHDAQKYLASRFFGNRKSELINVKNFEIVRGQINIRLPKELIFKIDNFQMGSELEMTEERLKEVIREAGHLE